MDVEGFSKQFQDVCRRVILLMSCIRTTFSIFHRCGDNHLKKVSRTHNVSGFLILNKSSTNLSH